MTMSPHQVFRDASEAFTIPPNWSPERWRGRPVVACGLTALAVEMALRDVGEKHPLVARDPAMIEITLGEPLSSKTGGVIGCSFGGRSPEVLVGLMYATFRGLPTCSITRTEPGNSPPDVALPEPAPATHLGHIVFAAAIPILFGKPICLPAAVALPDPATLASLTDIFERGLIPIFTGIGHCLRARMLQAYWMEYLGRPAFTARYPDWTHDLLWALERSRDTRFALVTEAPINDAPELDLQDRRLERVRAWTASRGLAHCELQTEASVVKSPVLTLLATADLICSLAKNVGVLPPRELIFDDAGKRGVSVTEHMWRKRAEQVLLRPWPPLLHGCPQAHPTAPRFFCRAFGARVVDEDGQEWLDLEMGRGPNLLGYGHPHIQEALQHHVKAGAAQASLLHRTEVQVAELLADAIPNVDRVVFAKNGSDVCAAAVRAARVATGRDTVLSSGYHGFQDWFIGELGTFEGFPVDYRGHLASFELNDVAGLGSLAERHASDLACILIEPAHRLLPQPGFLEAARQLADRYGALLIFDEVVTAFRLHPGGAQAAYGTNADLVCLGKAMANGLPISALAGRQDAMRHLDRTYFSMTFQHDSLAFAAAAACLGYVRSTTVAEALQARGEAVRMAFNHAAQRHGVPARALGFAGRLDFDFPPLGVLGSEDQQRVFLGALVEHRILPAQACFVCELFTDRDLDQATDAFDLAMQRIAQAATGRAS